MGDSGFNPRPTRRSGATGAWLGLSLPPQVSILARPEGRALHATPANTYTKRIVSILARPEGRALRGGIILVLALGGFQSSPDPKVGRYRRLLQRDESERVSILARPEGRALPIAKR